MTAIKDRPCRPRPCTCKGHPCDRNTAVEDIRTLKDIPGPYARAILELDNRLRALEVRPVAPIASAELPEGWTIDDDDEACFNGQPKAFINSVGDLVLRDIGIGASRPRIPSAVACALLARAEGK